MALYVDNEILEQRLVKIRCPVYEYFKIILAPLRSYIQITNSPVYLTFEITNGPV